MATEPTSVGAVEDTGDSPDDFVAPLPVKKAPDPEASPFRMKRTISGSLVPAWEEMDEWEFVLYMNKGKSKYLKEAFKNDRTSLSIFGALLMTIAFNAMLLSPTSYADNPYNLYFAHANVFFNFLSGLSALISVLLGNLQFMLLNRYPASRALEVIHAMTEDNCFGPMDEPLTWLWMAIFSLIAGASTTVYLQNGLSMFLMCCGTCGVLFPLALVVVLRTGSQTRKLVDSNFVVDQSHVDSVRTTMRRMSRTE